ncbi:activating transcription factor of chaperone isoform X1 [Armigeres subalbatus]|uniref:activating transcription factor of chaperone isoform X1 n=1 Tax=Armigeres subalbatus TaxID=124917 RepID=UPI002ED64992
MASFQNLDSFDWEGKMEPSSPSSQHSFYGEEFILEDYDFCNDGLFNNALFDIVVETKPVITSDLLKDSTMVMPLPPVEKVEKDQWLGEKLKIPQLSAVAGGYVSAPTAPSALVGIAPELGPFPTQRPPVKVQNTEELLMEFDFVYENVELTHLTPPQTPPQEDQYHAAGEQQQSAYIAVPAENSTPKGTASGQFYAFPNSLNGGIVLNQIPTVVEQLPAAAEPPQQVPGEYQLADSFGFQPVDDVENIARNLELVEEIVRSRSKDLPDCNDDDDDSCSFSEDGSVSSSCPMSDTSSSYCGSAYSRDQDDEWSPSSSYKKNSINKVSGGGVSKKRTRPYGRGIEDKKSRKKEQNKNAATRYRQKKKAEVEEILIVERQLKDKNEELKSKSADIGREIRYLKGLMREVCKAKGMLE